MAEENGFPNNSFIMLTKLSICMPKFASNLCKNEQLKIVDI